MNHMIKKLGIEHKNYCYKCFRYKSEECGGVSGFCEDYIHAPEISESEIKNWEKECDASRFRKRRLRRIKGGYSIEYGNY